MPGSNKGGFPPYGAAANDGKVVIEWISIYRLENGKLAEHWAVMDSVSLLAQIGAWKPPQIPGA